jgi:hypothetical protein
MRVHFISRLALLLVAAFGVVATQIFATRVWTEEALELIFVIGGGLAITVAAVDSIADGIAQRALDGLIVDDHRGARIHGQRTEVVVVRQRLRTRRAERHRARGTRDDDRARCP